jgi:hypothetical protein
VIAEMYISVSLRFLSCAPCDTISQLKYWPCEIPKWTACDDVLKLNGRRDVNLGLNPSIS